MQASGELPTPLPPYSIAIAAYLFGYSLWIVIGGMMLFSWVQRRLSLARQARHSSIPVSGGPPQQLTDGDQFSTGIVTPLLAPDEKIQHQAYAVTGSQSEALYLALTTHRLLLFTTKVGVFKPIFKVNEGVQTIARKDITKCTETALVLTTNLPFGDWATIFPNAACATALIDRIVHHADIIAIEGKSYRRRAAEESRKAKLSK